jgi:hypothetical protein
VFCFLIAGILGLAVVLAALGDLTLEATRFWTLRRESGVSMQVSSLPHKGSQLAEQRIQAQQLTMQQQNCWNTQDWHNFIHPVL